MELNGALVEHLIGRFGGSAPAEVFHVVSDNVRRPVPPVLDAAHTGAGKLIY